MSEVVGNISVVATINTKDYDAGKKKIESGNKELDASSKKTGDALDKNINDGTSKANASFESFKRASLIALAAVGTATIAFGISSVKAYNDAAEAQAQTEAVLKSTGQSAGVTISQVNKLATSFERVTPYADEVIQSAENMLLTFTNIGKKTFPAATEAVLNMSTAMGTDLKSTAIQVGKALQDPVVGVTALQRVGVRLTESQKDTVKSLVDVGDTAGAQAIILKELQTEFGGSAKAAGKTFAGQLTILKNRLGNVQEGIGEVIVKGIMPWITTSLDWFDSIGGVDGAMKILGDTFSNVKSFILPISNAVGNYLMPKLQGLWDSVNNNLIPILKDLWENVLVPLAPIFGELLVGSIGLAMDSLNFLLDAFKVFYDWTVANKDWLLPVIASLAAFKAAWEIWGVIDTVRVAMETFSLITIPSAIASFETFTAILATPLVMPAIVVVAALAAIASVMNAYNDMKSAIDGMNKSKQGLINTNKSSYALFSRIANDGVSSPEAKANAKKQMDRISNMKIPGLANGGSVSSSKPYFVGDNPDGSLNSTSELFVPKTSGTIISSNELQGIMGGGKNVTINQTNNVNTELDMDVVNRNLTWQLRRA